MDTHFHGVPMVVAQFTSFPPLSLGKVGGRGWAHNTPRAPPELFFDKKYEKKKRKKCRVKPEAMGQP